MSAQTFPSPRDLETQIKAQIPFDTMLEAELAHVADEVRRQYDGHDAFVWAKTTQYLVCCEVAHRLRVRGWDVKIAEKPFIGPTPEGAVFAYRIEPQQAP